MTEVYKFFEAGYEAGKVGTWEEVLEAYLEWCDKEVAGVCLNCGVSSHKTELRLLMDEWFCALCIPVDHLNLGAMIMEIRQMEMEEE
jgi:hypothetical protein